MTADNFAARLLQENLATKTDITDIVKQTNFDGKLKNLNRKVASNKSKHLQAEKKVTDLTNNIAQISEKRYDFLLGRMSFTGEKI